MLLVSSVMSRRLPRDDFPGYYCRCVYMQTHYYIGILKFLVLLGSKITLKPFVATQCPKFRKTGPSVPVRSKLDITKSVRAQSVKKW